MQKLDQSIIRTPLIPFHNRDTELQSQIFLKPENLQIFGSYKIRGIVAAVKNIKPAILSRGISAASAGNMAQAVAYVARELNIPCRIYVVETAPQVKLDAIQKLGAEIVKLPYKILWQYVNTQLTPPDDRFFIHPAFNKALLNGYSTIGSEIIQDMPDVDAVVIPFGVGGLSLGIIQAIRKVNSDIAIYTAEPETASPLNISLQHNKAMSIERTPSFVDAIGTPEVLPEVFRQLAPLVKDSLVMSLEEVKDAFRKLFFNNKLVTEGAAACSMAAAISLAKQNKYKKIVSIISGGNIDPTAMPLDTVNRW